MFENLKKRIENFEVKSKDFIRPQFLKEALGISTSLANELLELSVKFGYFKKRINVLSPVDKSVIAYFDTIDEIPEIVYDDQYPEDKFHAFSRKRDINENTEVVYVLPQLEGSRT